MNPVPESGRAEVAPAAPPVAPPAGASPARPKYLPVSFSQQRLWLLDQLVPGNAFYNEHTSFRFAFPLNVGVFERCLTEIVNRHESLRTTFTSVEGQPVQVIAPRASIPLTVVDLRDRPAEQRAPAAARLASAQAGEPFDLARGPLLRTALLQLDDAEYLFLLTVHHIVSDGWSLGILGRELEALYPAFATGRPSPLPPLPIQYGDFAVWQRKRLQGATLDAHLAYWRDALAGAPVLELPTDRPRPATQTFRGAAFSRVYPAALLHSLRELGHVEDATLFMTLLAGFELLLARYSGQDDVVVGVPVANRQRVELESVVGFFVNTLALRARIGQDLTVRELLRQVRQTAIDAYAHQDLPFERLVETLAPRRDLSRNPVFQVMFQLFAAQGTGAPPAVRPTIDVAATTSKFDLTVHLMECAEGLYARFEYSTDLFDAATIETLADRYARLLEAMALRPDAPALSLSMLSETERQRAITEWNATGTAYPRDASLQDLFEAQVQQSPDALAVQFGDEALTYRELNHRANALAASLRRLGVVPDARVAVLLERSLEMVVAVVAVIKAGGAYVPIDPSYPAERIRLMLEDADATAIVTRSALRALAPQTGAHPLLLDDPPPVLEGDEGNVSGGAAAGSLAYLIYTSGSTGVPKGVAVEQRGIARLVRNTNYVCIDPSDRFGQVSSFSFDAITFEIWGALLNGASLVGIRHDVALSSADFARALHDDRITTMFLTAALLRHIASEVPSAFRSMRTLVFGGEAADPAAIASVIAAGKPQRLLNGYGPTESTTFAAWHEVTAVEPGTASIPIGRPISNTQLYVLDERMELVPPGIAGELYIGGDGLARGYWRDEALTASRFVPHRFSTTPGARLYKSGDRVRQRADGTIEYLGRLDQQVKIRGFRVEPGEVEAALRARPGVREALVLSRQDGPGDRRLVGYVVADTAGPAQGLALRRALQESLPDHMVPSVIVCLPALPLTANGKVDRSRLPVPGDAAGMSGGVEPATELEQAIAAIWRDVLQVAQVGVHDNFFEIGGHSLLMARVHSRLKATLAPDVSMLDLFRYHTIHSLAAHLAGERSAAPAFLRSTQDRADRQRQRVRGPRAARGDEAR
jgi:amino acid adenylation domain-containing protein